MAQGRVRGWPWKRPLSIHLRPPVLTTHTQTAGEPLLRGVGAGAKAALRELRQGRRGGPCGWRMLSRAWMGVGRTCEKWELGWDQRTLECRAHSPGGTAVYFDLPRQLPHVSYLGAQSRLHLLLCCWARQADSVGYSPASCLPRPGPPLRAKRDKETKDVKEKGLPPFTRTLCLCMGHWGLQGSPLPLS